MLSDARRRRFDLLVLWKLDRFSRSLKDLITTLDELGLLRIDFISYDNKLDTSTPSGKLVFNIIGAVAEFERDIIRDRIRAGLANARMKGKKLGRPQIPKSDQKKIITLKNQGFSNRAIGKKLKIVGLFMHHGAMVLIMGCCAAAGSWWFQKELGKCYIQALQMMKVYNM